MDIEIVLMLGMVLLMLVSVIIWNVFQDTKLKKLRDYVLKNGFYTEKINEDIPNLSLVKSKVVVECENCKKLQEKLDNIEYTLSVNKEKKEKDTGADKNVRRKSKVLW